MLDIKGSLFPDRNINWTHSGHWPWNLHRLNLGTNETKQALASDAFSVKIYLSI